MPAPETGTARVTSLVPIGAPDWIAAAWSPAVEWLALANTRSTCATYLKVIRAFARGAGAAPAAITAADVAAYKAHLVSRDLAPRTIRLHLGVLRSFFTWCIEKGVYPGPRNPLDGIKLPRGRFEIAGRALEAAEVEALAAAARSARDRAIVLVLAGAGLRAQELLDLAERDFNAGDGASLLVRRGKGGRLRRVPLPVQAAAAIGDYLDSAAGRRRGATAPLFQSSRAAPQGMSYLNLYRIVVSCGERARLGHVSPHDLRRTYVTLRLDAGDPLPQVQRAVGHSTMAETAEYYRYRCGPEMEGKPNEEKECFPSYCPTGSYPQTETKE